MGHASTTATPTPAFATAPPQGKLALSKPASVTFYALAGAVEIELPMVMLFGQDMS